MLVVGLTGGIGSGKSAAADEFGRLGATVVDTDVIARELTAPGGAALPKLRALFGDSFVRPDGGMDREAMRRHVFSDPSAKRSLESLLHPMIREESQRRIATAQGPYVIHVVPLLVESPGFRGRFDRVLVIDCPEALQVDRVKARSGLAEDEVRAIIAQQAPRAARLAAADDVVDNGGTLEALRRQVAALDARYRKLTAPSVA